MDAHEFQIEYPNGHGGFDRYYITSLEVSKHWFQTSINGEPRRFFFRFVCVVRDVKGIELNRESWMRSLGIEPIGYDDANSFDFPYLPLVPGSSVLLPDDLMSEANYQQLTRLVSTSVDGTALLEGAPVFLVVNGRITPDHIAEAGRRDAVAITMDELMIMMEVGAHPIENSVCISIYDRPINKDLVRGTHESIH